MYMVMGQFSSIMCIIFLPFPFGHWRVFQICSDTVRRMEVPCHTEEHAFSGFYEIPVPGLSHGILFIDIYKNVLDHSSGPGRGKGKMKTEGMIPQAV